MFDFDNLVPGLLFAGAIVGVIMLLVVQYLAWPAFKWLIVHLAQWIG